MIAALLPRVPIMLMVLLGACARQECEQELVAMQPVFGPPWVVPIVRCAGE